MTVSDIIDRARLLADIGTTATFYTDTEFLFQINLAYRDVFEQILTLGDDYFTETAIINVSDLTADALEKYAYTYALPDDFYRLRSVEGLYNSQFYPMSLYGIQTKNGPGNNIWQYRVFGTEFSFFLKNITNLSKIRVRYFPQPTEYTAITDDIDFPPQLQPMILAYDVAINILIKKKMDTGPLQKKRDNIMEEFKLAINNRNNANFYRTQNAYQVN